MAVPKKRTSKAKKNQRKTCWKNKALKQLEKYQSFFQLQTFLVYSGTLDINQQIRQKTLKQEEKKAVLKQEKQTLKQKKKKQKEKYLADKNYFLTDKKYYIPPFLNKGVIQLPKAD